MEKVALAAVVSVLLVSAGAAYGDRTFSGVHASNVDLDSPAVGP
jgi:hypothetical protein